MTTPTTPSPDDPAALARELAAEIHQADQDCEYRTLPTERIACILIPTLERLVRERDLSAALFRQRDGELQETLAQAVDIERERNSLRTKLTAAQSSEREARALLEQAVGEMDRIAQIVDQEVDAPILDEVISKIRAYLARGAKGKPST